MIAALVRVAEAIREELATAKFDNQPLDPVRSYAEWDEKLEELDRLHVDVVPVIHREAELDDRGGVVYRCDVDIGLRLRFSDSDRDSEGKVRTDAIDRLVLLVERIAEYFIDAGRGRPLTDYPGAAWMATSIRQTFVRKHLRENGQFTSIIRLTYDVPK